MNSRVVITGAGIVSAIGTGAESFWHALAGGAGGVKPISRFEDTHPRCKMAAQVSGFDLGDHISYKGINLFSRSAQFVCGAGIIALKESELDLSLVNRNEVGVALGTAFGSASSMEAFDEECQRDGERFVDPMRFPNTVANSPAGCLSILTGAAGLNVTVSTGLSSGLAALEYAASLLAQRRMRVMLAGGYDELSMSARSEMIRAGLLSGSREGDFERSAPFDRSRNGFFLGEGAGVLVLERLEDALARDAHILAELAGFGASYCLHSSRAVESQFRAMTGALENGGLRADDVDLVSASASGSVEGDRRERLSIEELFGDRAYTLPVTAIKSLIGECGGASGAIQLIAATLSMRYNALTPTISFIAGDDDCLLRNIVSTEQAADCGVVLVNSFNGVHNNSSAVVKKFSY
ncbi:MAG TPA: beta-ketoacyl-[acyl-carrier-protein] synthase family protein [Blastocatellia bacterium]|nr:beta-ketoacyl-[acyl-carrier-protein] synthase family protein [Blastocatellia bacterium]